MRGWTHSEEMALLRLVRAIVYALVRGLVVWAAWSFVAASAFGWPPLGYWQCVLASMAVAALAHARSYEEDER